MLVTAGFFLDVRIVVNFQFLKHAFLQWMFLQAYINFIIRKAIKKQKHYNRFPDVSLQVNEHFKGQFAFLQGKKVTVYSFIEQLCFMLRLFSVQEAPAQALWSTQGRKRNMLHPLHLMNRLIGPKTSLAAQVSSYVWLLFCLYLI